MFARYLDDGPANYAWEITKDFLADGFTDSEVGIRGPSNAPDELIKLLEKGKGITFNMYDDDGEKYYSGRIVKKDEMDYADEEICFAPLDDFGTPNAGCTEIKYPRFPQYNCG